MLSFSLPQDLLVARARVGVRRVHALRFLEQQRGIVAQLGQRLQLVRHPHQQNDGLSDQQSRKPGGGLGHRRAGGRERLALVIGVDDGKRLVLEDDRQRNRGRRSAPERHTPAVGQRRRPSRVSTSPVVTTRVSGESTLIGITSFVTSVD